LLYIGTHTEIVGFTGKSLGPIATTPDPALSPSAQAALLVLQAKPSQHSPAATRLDGR
jgi:hypothetical protein